jgi:hypothetical protein
MHETPETIAARKFAKQKEFFFGLTTPDHEATEDCRHALELYA